mgnify:CR=1 FL=1
MAHRRAARQQKNIHRVLFNEITKKAVQEAIKKPLKLDRAKFDAQQARRVLDRLVGYQLSPLLWDKVRRGLSAGRVQSVAVRLITERERAIRAFVKEEYWTIGADARRATLRRPSTRNLFELAGKRLDHKTFRLENEARRDRRSSTTSQVRDWVVAKVEKSDRKRNPSPPFITSRLQQEASRKLGYQPRRTMGIAQKLYEGVEIGDEGAVGLITYMRTDSTRLSPDAVEAVRGLHRHALRRRLRPREAAGLQVEEEHAGRARGDPPDQHRVPARARRPVPREGRAQPLHAHLEPLRRLSDGAGAPQGDHHRHQRQGHDLPRDRSGRRLRRLHARLHRGRRRRAPVDDEDGKTLPDLKEGDRLQLRASSKPEQHFTQPPPRFSQATLIKELEENGIGRPSTYASIMQTILSKEYVQEDPQKRLFPTELGMLVTDLLVGSFPDILNVDFTAGMEEDLDGIEEGTQNWVEVMRRFYEPFSKDLDKAGVEMRNVKAEERPTDIKCDLCGETMVIKWGRRGEFLACRSYPECKGTKNFTRDENGDIVIAKAETTDEVCDKCGKPMLVRFGRFGKFLGCSGYPECKTIVPMIKPAKLGIACPDCGGANGAESLGGRSSRSALGAARSSTAATAIPTASSRAGTARSRCRARSARRRSWSRRRPSAPAPYAAVSRKVATSRRPPTSPRTSGLKHFRPVRFAAALRPQMLRWASAPEVEFGASFVDGGVDAPGCSRSGARAGTPIRHAAHVMAERVTIIGGGLAGSEAAWQLARRGVGVDLYEMRPVRGTEAHQTDQLAELVCSNSFRNASLETAVGCLKDEMRRLGSLILRVADRTTVPAGACLAVDRTRFAAGVTQAIAEHPAIRLHREELTAIPDGVTIVATGPLTSPALSTALERLFGAAHLYFYDAIAPIVSQRLDRHDDRLQGVALRQGRRRLHQLPDDARGVLRVRRRGARRREGAGQAVRADGLFRRLHADRGDGAARS